MRNPFLDDVAPTMGTRNPFLDDAVPSSGFSEIQKGGTAREVPAPYQIAGSLGEGSMRAAQNLIPSAKQFGSDMWSVVSDLPGTAKTFVKVGLGAAQKLVPGEQEYEGYADKVGEFYVNRYGSVENALKTFETDPVGFFADAATVFLAPELALARAPGVAGQIGRAAGSVSRAIDPVAQSLKVAKTGLGAAGKAGAGVLGVMTGAGGKAVGQAARSGFEGGEAGRTFRDNMRGNAVMEDVVTDATKAVSAIKQKRSAAYKSGMANTASDATVLDFAKIEQALNATRADTMFSGRSGAGPAMSKSPSADATIAEMAKVIDEWKALDPAEYHTAIGFDALKQRLGDIREGAKYGTNARRVADQVYNVVKDQIVKQAPDYAKTMKGYEEASKIIREIEGTLSLNPKARVDTALRKLQSVMRDNVNTNYGKRTELVDLLEANGAKNLLNALAGQSMKSLTPRGLAGVGVQGAITAGAGMLNPYFLATLPAQSPRIVGEAVHAGGQAANALSRVPARNALLTGYQSRSANSR